MVMFSLSSYSRYQGLPVVDRIMRQSKAADVTSDVSSANTAHYASHRATKVIYDPIIIYERTSSALNKASGVQEIGVKINPQPDMNTNISVTFEMNETFTTVLKALVNINMQPRHCDIGTLCYGEIFSYGILLLISI
jgi:hypothetical protein